MIYINLYCVSQPSNQIFSKPADDKKQFDYCCVISEYAAEKIPTYARYDVSPYAINFPISYNEWLIIYRKSMENILIQFFVESPEETIEILDFYLKYMKTIIPKFLNSSYHKPDDLLLLITNLINQVDLWKKNINNILSKKEVKVKFWCMFDDFQNKYKNTDLHLISSFLLQNLLFQKYLLDGDIKKLMNNYLNMDFSKDLLFLPFIQEKNGKLEIISKPLSLEEEKSAIESWQRKITLVYISDDEDETDDKCEKEELFRQQNKPYYEKIKQNIMFHNFLLYSLDKIKSQEMSLQKNKENFQNIIKEYSNKNK